ncbi:WhiB family transcriptional regulator [Rhodococcus sp. H-CA8f]|uniref:WhiB family transcriptional regulator n=1 Tax=Rhodococcus sp. H-CA8f TaxID=1727214 RepID=UPI001E4E2DCB|nr:WhiB family transcriptional regulator [Rhodococcus sp. H-CA8f]
MTAMIERVDLITSILGPAERQFYDQSWRHESLCSQADSETFFPDVRAKTQAKKAKRICGQCPVATECLEFALTTHERFGVWGGKTPVERRDIARARNAATQSRADTNVRPALSMVAPVA